MKQMIRNCITTTSLLLFIILTISCQKVVTGSKGENILEEMILIPAGEFIMGSDEVDKGMMQQRFGIRDIPYQNEHPRRIVNIGKYYIDKYEITNKQYKDFLDATKYITPSYWYTTPSDWKNDAYPEGMDNLPVTMVNWYNADSYCRWKGKRLPTEPEWEKAARGTDGRRFPWGNEFDETKMNSMGTHGGVTPVGQFKGDVSPYGVYDMGGNVAEWVSEWYKGYPGNKFEDLAYGEKFKAYRGGHWGGIGHYNLELFYRSSFRDRLTPDRVLNIVGFRCAYSEEN